MVCRTVTHLAIFAGSIAGSVLLFLSSPDRLDAAYREPAHTDEATEALVDPSDIPGADLDQIAAVRRDLDRQVKVMAERINTKELLIKDLVDGKTTLREVAEKFHKMNAEFPACMSVIRARYPNIPDEERMARNVLEFVHLQDIPAKQLKIVEARLSEEFYQVFGHRDAIAY